MVEAAPTASTPCHGSRSSDFPELDRRSPKILKISTTGPAGLRPIGAMPAVADTGHRKAFGG
jgi:hypothetical protein